jgi:hypothetical protein
VSELNEIENLREGFESGNRVDWESNFVNLNFANTNPKPRFEDPRTRFPYNAIINPERTFNKLGPSRLEQYILQLPVYQEPEPCHDYSPTFVAYLHDIGQFLDYISHHEYFHQEHFRQENNVLPDSNPILQTQREIERLWIDRNITFYKHRLREAFLDPESWFAFMQKLIATTVIEARATTWAFGEGQRGATLQRARNGLVRNRSALSLVRRQCACHLLQSYNEYILDNERQREEIESTHLAGSFTGFGWGHRILTDLTPATGATICTLCKVDRFTEGYTRLIDSVGTVDLYHGCHCPTLIDQPEGGLYGN